jgi:hypothetical protein
LFADNGDDGKVSFNQNFFQPYLSPVQTNG